MKSLLAGAIAVAASLSFLPAASAAPVAVSPAAPYLFLGWGEPPSPSAVMEATGVKSFTMAFVLSDGGCSPAWDGARPLTGGADQAAIDEIRAAGGDIVPSFGGWSGDKLGPNCESPEALAGAYQEVIDAYGLSAIDIDIENTDELLRLTERPEDRLDVAVVGHVVATVVHRRRIPRVEPDRVDAEIGQVPQVRPHTGQVNEQHHRSHERKIAIDR